jgi:Protein of unknown function (DUF3305)
MAADTQSLDRSDALQKVGPIPSFIEFTKTPNQGVGWRLTDISPNPPNPRITPVGTGLHGQINDRHYVELELWVHRDEGEGYYLNLESPEPSIFVKWRLKEATEGEIGAPEAIAISLSYNEAGRWLDAGEPVDRVLMPAEMLPWLAEFTQLHYEPEGKKKKRGPKPSFMTRSEFSEMTTREISIHRNNHQNSNQNNNKKGD